MTQHRHEARRSTRPARVAIRRSSDRETPSMPSSKLYSSNGLSSREISSRRPVAASDAAAFRCRSRSSASSRWSRGLVRPTTRAPGKSARCPPRAPDSTVNQMVSTSDSSAVRSRPNWTHRLRSTRTGAPALLEPVDDAAFEPTERTTDVPHDERLLWNTIGSDRVDRFADRLLDRHHRVLVLHEPHREVDRRPHDRDQQRDASHREPGQSSQRRLVHQHEHPCDREHEERREDDPPVEEVARRILPDLCDGDGAGDGQHCDDHDRTQQIDPLVKRAPLPRRPRRGRPGSGATTATRARPRD